MYINGTIQTSSSKVWALPEEAIVNEDEKSFMFLAVEHNEDGRTEWSFTPEEIITGTQQGSWVEVKLLRPLPEDAQMTMNNAYYLISEMKKSNTSHGH